METPSLSDRLPDQIIGNTPRLQIFLRYMSRKLSAISSLIERTVESRQEEHDNLSAHSQEDHQFGSGKMRQREESTCNNDTRTPTICIVQESLSRNTIHPLLQTIYNIIFTIAYVSSIS